MLKAIELYGFKSFADRTRLEFGEGISAVVGPNGSGKSNIVDAIKWVLGEQSVKKLRGSEMTDVIFSGSGTRQAVGSAEVTLSFDNSKRTFDLDTPEVHITRRIYRSGESEYLINRQTARLKDIKEILSGTGLGTQAYSIIEQGRVEMLLQSTPLQRRGIFEEAAGISRFNLKKLETQRRLERVEQNLIRISDIISEIDNQRKSAKSQAGKAQLYRQYTARLQELRIHAGLLDWRKNEARRLVLHEEIETLLAAEKEVEELLERYENSSQRHNARLEEANRTIGRVEGEIIAVKERIASEESTLEFQTEQVQTFDAEILQHGRRLLDLNERSGDAEDMMRKTDEEIRSARKFHVEIGNVYAECRKTAGELSAQCERLRELRARVREELEEKNREISRLSGELGGLESRAKTLRNNREIEEKKLEKLTQESETVLESLTKFNQEAEELTARAKRQSERVEAAKTQKTQRIAAYNTLQQELLAEKQRLSAMSERISVLEELLRKHEGLSPGVKEVMRQSRLPESPFRFVYGLVADLIRVDVEVAPLIEKILGEKAKLVVVSPEPELFRHIEQHSLHFPGSVGFTWLDPRPNELPWAKETGFEGKAGVLGRADHFVQTDPKFTHFAQRLLGHTWIVQDMTIAKRLYRESDDRTNFITRNGEYLAADGTLIVGPPSGSSGVITRRSELRTLAEQLLLIEAQIREKEASMAVQKNRMAEDEREIEELEQQRHQGLTEIESKKNLLKTAEERSAQLVAEQLRCREELQMLGEQLQCAEESWEQAKCDKTKLETEIFSLEENAAETLKSLQEQEKRYTEHEKKTTNAKIELAKSEERLSFLQERIVQYEDHQLERRNLLDDHRQRVQKLLQRRDQTLLTILRIESVLAESYVRKEHFANSVQELYRERSELLTERNHAQSELKKAQQEHNRIRNKIHSKQLELDRIVQEQGTLVARIKEEYSIDIEEIDAGSNTLPFDLHGGEEEIEARSKEIESLRQKIQKLGGVNPESIESFEELEIRYTTLSNHYQDLTNAKKSIEKIIEKNNIDSQRLFEETFLGVKSHFQDLYQQLFGGGFADLKLEDETNVLESGVEIVARPPGKELKSVSLLSGGEKTLTCVALLLAFFRFRPNPVCILDEVDAALDEGNIDRFVRVVKEFRTKTQFLIITHSKKTMSCASTLYGITMQDSGVSKPISVRFVDVGENGEILDTSYHEAEAANAENAAQSEEPPIFRIDTPAETDEPQSRAA